MINLSEIRRRNPRTLDITRLARLSTPKPFMHPKIDVENGLAGHLPYGRIDTRLYNAPAIGLSALEVEPISLAILGSQSQRLSTVDFSTLDINDNANYTSTGHFGSDGSFCLDYSESTSNKELEAFVLTSRIKFEGSEGGIDPNQSIVAQMGQRNQRFTAWMVVIENRIQGQLNIAGNYLRGTPITNAAKYTCKVLEEAAKHQSRLATAKMQMEKVIDRHNAAPENITALTAELQSICDESIARLNEKIKKEPIAKRPTARQAIYRNIQHQLSSEEEKIKLGSLIPGQADAAAGQEADDDPILQNDTIQSAIANIVKALPKLAKAEATGSNLIERANELSLIFKNMLMDPGRQRQGNNPHPKRVAEIDQYFKAAEKNHQDGMLAIHKEQGTGDLYTSVHAPLNALRQVSSTATAELTELSTDTIGIVAQTKAINQLLGELGKHEDILQSRPDMTHCYKKDIDRTISELKSRQRELVRLVQITLGSKVNRLQHNPYETQAFMAELDALSRALRLSPQEAPQLRGHSNLTTTDKGLASLQDETTTQHWIKGKNGTYSAKQLTCTIKDKETGKEIERIVIFSKADLLELLNKFKDEHMIDPVVRESPNKITITWPGKSIYGGGQGQNAKDTWMEYLKSAYKAKNESKPTTTATVEAASPQAADAIAAAPMLRGGP